MDWWYNQAKQNFNRLIPRIENYFLKLQKAQSIREKIGKLDQQQSKYSVYINENPKQQ